MNSSEITTAVSEALQRHIPLIVEEVTTKLTKKEKWEDYSVEKLSAMAASEDYKQRCSAAAHPRTPMDIINRLLGDSNHNVRMAAGRNPNTPLTVLASLSLYPSLIKRLKTEGNLNQIMMFFDDAIKHEANKSTRQNFRMLIEERILNGDFDEEINSSIKSGSVWYGIFNLNTPAKSLINWIENTSDFYYDFKFICSIMIKYRVKKFLQSATQDEKDLLIHLMPRLASFMTTS
jgi:hypothetical protein